MQTKQTAVLLSLVALFTTKTFCQSVPYGNNPAAGHYLAMKDSTKIYYELYGSGRPVVLLHGGLYGDISEYEKLIPVLSKHFTVIAVETRGHGKSYIGNQPFTYEMMADDAYTVIRHITTDSAIVIGFSDGAVIAMNLTINHPELVRKLVYAGGNLSADNYKPGVMDELKQLTGASLERDDPAFVKDRKAVMPQPERWDEFVEKLKHAWLSQVKVDTAQLKTVKCPVLVAGGDHDQYNTVENFVNVYYNLPHASLAIVPNSDHIIFYRKPELMEKLVMEFVRE